MRWWGAPTYEIKPFSKRKPSVAAAAVMVEVKFCQQCQSRRLLRQDSSNDVVLRMRMQGRKAARLKTALLLLLWICSQADAFRQTASHTLAQSWGLKGFLSLPLTLYSHTQKWHFCQHCNAQCIANPLSTIAVSPVSFHSLTFFTTLARLLTQTFSFIVCLAR